MNKYYYLLLFFLIVNLTTAQRYPKLIPVMKDNKWGFTNRKLQFVIKPIYDDVLYPFTVYSLPKTKTIDTLACVKLGEERLFINKKGIKVSAPKDFHYNDRLNAPQFEMSVLDVDQEKAMIKKREAQFVKDPTTGKIGIKEELTDIILVQPQYDNISKIFSAKDKSSDLYSVALDKKWGVIDVTGKIILNLEYSYIEGLRYYDGNHSYCFSVMKDNKQCVVNEKSIPLVCSDDYTNLGGANIQHIEMYRGRKDRKNYLYNFNKQQFINQIGYDNFDSLGFQEGLLRVKKDSKIFYIDENGKAYLLK